MTAADVTAPAGARAPQERRALTLAVWQVACGAVAAGIVELLIFYSGNAVPPPWHASLVVVCAWFYVPTGAYVALRWPDSRVGLLMTAGACSWLAAGLSNAPVPALTAVGLIALPLPLGFLVHLLLAFPSGRLERTAERAVAGAAYATVLLLQVPVWLFGPGPLQVADEPGLRDAAFWTQLAATVVVVLAAAALLARRLRATAPARRRVLAPLYAYGLVTALALPLGAGLIDRLDGRHALAIGCVQMGLAAGLALLIAAVVWRAGLARPGAADALAGRLADGGDGRPLDVALADALGDPTVELLFRVPGERGWVNDAGVATFPPSAGARRGVAEVELGGATIGAVVYDAALQPDQGELRTLAAAVAPALDRERMAVALRASRARLLTAGDSERRRIARDLHERLQSRLALLAVQAGVAHGSGDGLRAEIETVIDELRVLVHGVMPAELTEHGLPAAVEQLARGLPLAVELEVSGFATRPAPAVESTGWFVVAEAIVNAVKHARAELLTVTLAHDAGRLRIGVRDDGIGGAGGGAGLRAITDRVEALGGAVRIDSATGGGTHVQVELPCAA